jgi:hypothetical protein
VGALARQREAGPRASLTRAHFTARTAARPGARRPADAFYSIIPPHFYCDFGAWPLARTDCPKVTLPTGVDVPTWAYVCNKYGFDCATQFPTSLVGYLCIFILVFQAGHLLSISFIRHIVR